MITLGDILKPRHVALAMAAADVPSALDQLARRLQGDARITNWPGFYEALKRGADAGLTVLSCGAALCHARTEGVAEIVMSAGRLVEEIAEPARPDRPGIAFKILFVIGLPPTMASEYLRMVGALARALKDASAAEQIGRASTADEFVEILSQRELTP